MAKSFLVKTRPKGVALVKASFRVPLETYDRLRDLARKNGLPIQEVVRQMVDFCLAHMEKYPEPTLRSGTSSGGIYEG